MEPNITTLLPASFNIIAMHSVCCCSLPLWGYWKKGTPWSILARPGSWRIWPKTTTLVRDHKAFYLLVYGSAVPILHELWKKYFFYILSHTFATKASANLQHYGESFGTSRNYFDCLKYKSFCYQSFSGHGLYRKCFRQVTLRFWKKSYSHSRSGSQKQGRGKFDASFSWGGSPSSQGGMTPKLNEIGNNFNNDLTMDMLLLIHWKSFEFSTWLTREMFIWLKNSTLGISNSEDFHYLHWRLVADYPGHVNTYFRTQCQRPVHPKDLICDI